LKKTKCFGMEDWNDIENRVAPYFGTQPLALATDRAALHALLQQWIYQLLDQQPEQLAQLMYRLDVAEPLFQAALYASQGLPEAASRVADLVIDRELQRLALRRRFS
jgi:hypothetical protein